jgi:predicted XRE-type DNA-binding protein
MPNTSKKETHAKQKNRNRKTKMTFEIGSGNVFADIGLEDPEVLAAKSDLLYRIDAIIESRGLTQVEAAKLLGVDQPKVSALRRGKLSEFSLERLMRFLRLLNQQVEISVKPSTSGQTLRVAPPQPGVSFPLNSLTGTSQAAVVLMNEFSLVAGSYDASAMIVQPKSDQDIENDPLPNTFALVAGEQTGYAYAQEE